MTCLKSEIGMMTAESPQKSRTVLVLSPATWKISSERLTTLVSELSDNNWVKLADFDLVAAAEPSENYLASRTADSRDLSRTLIQRAQTLKLRTENVASIYDDQDLSSGFTSARVLGFSDLWPSNARASEYLSKNISLLDSYLNAVSIQVSGRVTTPEVSSEIPITVVNESDAAVSVSVNLSSSATSRFTAEPTGIIQVDSGQRVTIPVAINLIGAGVVDVQAQLIAPNGESFGQTESFQISSATYGQFARTLVLVAFGLLVMLSLNSYVKRRKAKNSLKASAR